MEKRLLLFFALTFLIVSLWWRIFPPPTVPLEPAEPVPGVDVVDEPEPAEPAAEAETEPPPSSEAPSSPRAAGAEQRIVLENDVFVLEFSNRGAHLVSARLKSHEDEDGDPYELVSRVAAEKLGVYPLDVRVPNAGGTGAIANALFEVQAPETRRLSGEETAELRFAWADGRGLEVEKILGVRGDSYGIDVSVSVREGGQEIAKEVLYGPGLGMEAAEGQYVGVEKGVLVSRGEVELFAASDLEEAGTGVSVEATGVASHYFAALMLPVRQGLYGARLESTSLPAVAAAEDEPAQKARDVITAVLEAPREPAAFELFLGPKKLELLESLAPGLSRIIEFGDWMRYPALLLRAGLMRLYGIVGNYGWAIVLLTIVINLLLVPLKHYSFVSMRKMQKLAPQIQRIRERYKKVKPTDPRYQHMNQEIMALYKEHKVSPVSGCLPMLLMIPFFFAFYRLLMASVELRHAPFVLWIQDLSHYDPYFVLPILMGVSQVAIQKMTPQTTADPVQAKIMSFMPIVFTFILAWAPSGLVLYWFANNLVSAAQQIVTNRLLSNAEDEEGGARGAKAKKAAKHAQVRS